MRSGNIHNGHSERCLGLKLLPHMPTGTVHEYTQQSMLTEAENIETVAISTYEHARQTSEG